ncbi:MAG: hypothetical protein WC809_01765 [Sinimarinibacterium sp.]
MSSLLRRPLLHFMVLGALLFTLQRWLLPEEPLPFDDTPIRINAAAIAQLRESWLRDSGRAPTAAQLQASLQRYIDDEILVREALGRGLGRSDPVVRERLLRNMRFLYPERRVGDDTLLSEAAALGMTRSDPVVRRRLLQAMERRLVDAVPLDAQALAAYGERHAARYRPSGRISFRHVFLSDDIDHADPRAALEQLRTGLDRGEADAQLAGDAFLLGREFSSWTAAQVGARFGTDFAESLAQASTQAAAGAWIGPLRSVFGWHLVEVTARVAGGQDTPPELQAQLVRAWQDEARAQSLRAELQRLRARYRVVGLPSTADVEPA